MSDTPRTDAELYTDGHDDHAALVPAEFARQLERELQNAQFRLAAWFVAARPYCTPSELCEAMIERRRRPTTDYRIAGSCWTRSMKWRASRYRYYGWCLIHLRFRWLAEYIRVQWRLYRWRVLLP